MKKLLFILCCLPVIIAAQELYPADPTGYGADFTIDVQHYAAQIAFRPFDSVVTGDVEFLFTVLPALGDSLRLVAPGFSNVKAWMDHQSVELVMAQGTIRIPSAGLKPWTSHQLRLTYESGPARREIFFIGWNDSTNTRRKQIWSHRPYGWLPFADDRDRCTVSLAIAFDSAYSVYTNGVRDSVIRKPGGKLTWYYTMKQPHPFFSTALAIGKYKWREQTAGDGTPLEQWYYPDLPDRVDATYRLSEQMFPFLEDALGTPYPWPVYREAPLTDYPYGAMETTTATVFNDRYLVNYSTSDSNAYVNINCHELAHQWLGNYISHLNPRDVWITESTATYFAKLFERRVFGEDRYQDERLDEMLTAVKNPPSDDFPVAHSRGGVSRWYDKGSLVLDLLRETIGDSAFRLGMRTYFQQFGNNLATSSDLAGCFEKASGRNLKTFTDQWLYRAGEPVIETSRITTPRGVFAIIRQTQPVDDLHPVFKIETTIEIRMKDGEVKRIAARLQSPADTIPLKGCKEEDIAYILTDPDRFIPSVQKYSGTSAEAFAVLMNSPSVIALYEAMNEWLGSNEVTAGQLLQAWDKENHVRTRIRNGILKGMSRHLSPAISKAIAEACFHSDEPVRRAVAVVFDTIPPAFRKTWEKMLYDRSPMVATLAFDRLCFSFPESFARYNKLVKSRLLQTDFRGRIIWLGHALRNEYCRAYFDELTEYTTPRYNLRTSRHAAEVLKSLK